MKHLDDEINIAAARRSPSLSQRIVDVLYKNAQSTILSDDESELTGEECLRAIVKIKRAIELNVPPRGRVGILFPNTAAQALSILATIVAKRVPVVLNATTSGDGGLHKNWDSLNMHGVIIAGHHNMELPDDVPIIRLAPGGEILTIYGNPTFRDKPVPREGTALILYTSGSSGEPKGVEIPEAGLTYTINYLINYFGLNQSSVAAVTLPMFHTMGLNTQFFPTLFAGGKCVFIETDLSLGKIYRNIIKAEGTFVSLIGDMLRLCSEEKLRRNVKPALRVKDVQIAGGMILREHLEMAQDLFPNARLHKGYGLTEAIRVSMINSDNPLFFSDTAGHVLSGQDVQIRNAMNRVLPPGVVGQIFVKGPNVMLGYDGIAQSPVESDGYLPSGDLGVMTHDRRLVIHGRLDSIFKSQGRRVATKEIEKVAMEDSHVRDAKCIPVPCAHKGLRPVLFVETADENGHRYFSGEWRNAFEMRLKKELETYKIPRDIFVVPRFPRTANGKVQAKELQHLWDVREKAPDLGRGTFGCRFKGAPVGYVGVPFQ